MDDLLYQLKELQREHRALLRTNLILQRQKNRAVGICFELKQFWQQRDAQDDMKTFTLAYDEEGKESSADLSEFSNEAAIIDDLHLEASHNDDLGEQQSQGESVNSESEFLNIIQGDEDLLGKSKEKHPVHRDNRKDDAVYEKYYDPQAKLKRQERLERIKTQEEIRHQSRIGLFDLERACMLQREKRKYRGRPRPKKIVNTKVKSKEEHKNKKKQPKSKNPKPYYRNRKVPKKVDGGNRRRTGKVRNSKQRMERMPASPYQFPWYPGIPNRPNYNNYRYPTNVQYYPPHMYERNSYLSRRGGPSIIRPNINTVRRPRPTRPANAGGHSRIKASNSNTRSRQKRGHNSRFTTKSPKSYYKHRRNVTKGTSSTVRKVSNFSGEPTRGIGTQWSPP